MKIGTQIPTWRVPTFSNGKLSYSSLTEFLGEYLVICCTQSLTASQVWLLESRGKYFRRNHACLVTLATRYMNHELPWSLPRLNLRLPLLTDPLRRLSRSLGLTENIPDERCETLFFNQDGRLEFRLIHDLNQSGLTRVLEITERLLAQSPSSFLEKSSHVTLIGSGT